MRQMRPPTPAARGGPDDPWIANLGLDGRCLLELPQPSRMRHGTRETRRAHQGQIARSQTVLQALLIAHKALYLLRRYFSVLVCIGFVEDPLMNRGDFFERERTVAIDIGNGKHAD